MVSMKDASLVCQDSLIGFEDTVHEILSGGFEGAVLRLASQCKLTALQCRGLP